MTPRCADRQTLTRSCTRLPDMCPYLLLQIWQFLSFIPCLCFPSSIVRASLLLPANAPEGTTVELWLFPEWWHNCGQSSLPATVFTGRTGARLSLRAIALFEVSLTLAHHSQIWGKESGRTYGCTMHVFLDNWIEAKQVTKPSQSFVLW